LPSAAVGLLAASETASLMQSLDRDAVGERIVALQNRLSLGPPPPEVTQALERMHRTLDQLQAVPHERADAVDGRLVDVKPLFESLTTDGDLIEKRLGLNDAPPPRADAAPAAATPPATEAPPAQLVEAWQAWRKAQSKVKPLPDDDAAWQAEWSAARAALDHFQNELLGGPIAAWFKRNIHVDPDQLQKVLDRLRSAAGPAALGTTTFLANFFVQFTIGLIVMLVGAYYFLADGREMANSLMRLTPLDRKYAEQLGIEFANLTRAVVLSMLLAAVAQGLLAGVGYWLCGLDAIFLLILLTTLFAMVPLVGATVVWGGAAVWLFFDGHITSAVALTVYGIVVVSLADNLIKPMILHGRSNLHPLAALLSVLGGVQALGPIGVFVGPMVVALLHTLLVMLQKELKIIDHKSTATVPPT
jgi:predicted PurR-regulated permease PerM